MNTCYKCGCELPYGGNECDPPCAAPSESILTEEQIAQAMEDYAANSVAIDWEKVQTVDDLKLIMQTFLFDDKVQRGSMAYQKLRKFLKEKNPHD